MVGPGGGIHSIDLWRCVDVLWQSCVCPGAALVLPAVLAALLLALALDLDAVLAAQRAGLEATAFLLAGVLERQHLRVQQSLVSAPAGGISGRGTVERGSNTGCSGQRAARMPVQSVRTLTMGPSELMKSLSCRYRSTCSTASTGLLVRVSSIGRASTWLLSWLQTKSLP
jgi:hypothetical protein